MVAVIRLPVNKNEISVIWSQKITFEGGTHRNGLFVARHHSLLDCSSYKTKMRPGNNSVAGNYRDHRSPVVEQKTVNVKKGLLRLFSVINILIYSLCVGLEAVHPYVGQGVWGSSIHMMSGLVGFGASYRPTRTRLSWALAFSCLSIMFALIVSGLSWAGYTDCDHYYPDLNLYTYSCDKPASQLALMVVNIIALIFSLATVVLVARPICCAPVQSQTRSRFANNVSVSIIGRHTSMEDSNLSMGMTTVISSSRLGIPTFPAHRPEREILARLALYSRCQEEQEERPPRYSIAVAEVDVHEEET